MMLVPGSAFMPRQRVAGVDYDPYWANVVLLLHLNGNLTDEKGHTVFQAMGTANFVAGMFGDGHQTDNDSYVQTEISSDFGTGNQNFTLEWWAKINTATPGGSDSRTMMHWVQNDPSEVTAYIVQYNFWSKKYAAASTESSVLVDTPLTWQHYAFVRNGSSLILYVNGTSVISATPTVVSTNGRFIIGNNKAGYTNSEWPGVIDEIRHTKGVARYTANFTPPTAPFPNS
jgi:hypothetical protein